MLEQIENTIKIISNKIAQFEQLQKDNEAYIKEAIEYGETPQSEVDDRMSLAREYNRLLQVAKVEKEHLQNSYYNKYKPKYTNVPDDVINFLKKFFSQLDLKTIGYSEARYVNHSLNYLEGHPFLPEKNCVVSFQIDNSSFYVVYTDYKIELSQWVSDSQAYSNDSHQAHLFKYELEGYKEEIGDLYQLLNEILNKLEEVKVTDISISEEE